MMVYLSYLSLAVSMDINFQMYGMDILSQFRREVLNILLGLIQFTMLCSIVKGKDIKRIFFYDFNGQHSVMAPCSIN